MRGRNRFIVHLLGGALLTLATGAGALAQGSLTAA